MTITAFVRLIVLSLISLSLLGLTACSLLPAPTTDPTRYYVLTGVESDMKQPAKNEHAWIIGLKRIEIAPYLNGKDLVVREAGNEITYHSFSRWAEPLVTSIGNALADSLGNSSSVRRIYTQPFPFDVARDYDLAVSISRFEGERRVDGRIVASLVAEVEITEAKAGGALVLRKTFIAPELDWDGKDFGALAVALSAGVHALGADLVNSLPTQ
jgi:uncharacterized lipoprotein YmbA